MSGMSNNKFIINSISLSEVDEFVKFNVEIGFISPYEYNTFKECISCALKVFVLRTEDGMKGGVMIHKRWKDAVWVTNIFVHHSIYSIALR
jgi:hypothetical protein